MPSYKELYPDKWLTADHLQNKTVTITIKAVGLAEAFNPMTNKKEMRLAASFPNRYIKMLINKTNAQTLQKITGTDDYDKWRNIQVTLRPGTAPNGKPTIILGRAATPAPASNPVHGPQAARPAPAPVHGREEDEIVDGEMEMHGFDFDDAPDDEDEMTPVHGTQEEEVSAAADPKSGGAGRGYSLKVEDVFFSITDLTTKVRSLHQQSSEPMTERQYDYILNQLTAFTTNTPQTVLSMLLGSDVDENNRPGAEVGRYLYELVRVENPLPDETNALHNYCKDYVPKPKKQPA